MTTDGQILQSPAPADTQGARAWLDLQVTLGDVRRATHTLVNYAHQAARAATPTEMTLVQGAAIPASGFVVIDMGAPAMGRRWSVKNLAVAPANSISTGTLSGSANWYVGNPATFGPAEWAAPTMATLPAFATIGADQMNVTPTNHLFVVITGSTAGQQAIARAYVLDYPQYSGHPTIEL